MGISILAFPIVLKSFLTASSGGPYHSAETWLVAGLLLGFGTGTALMRSVVGHSLRQIAPPGVRTLVLGMTQDEADRSDVLRVHREACEWIGFVSPAAGGGLSCSDILGARKFEDLDAVLDEHPVDEVFHVARCDGIDPTSLRDTCATRGLTYRTLVYSPLGRVGRYTAHRVGAGEYVISFETVAQNRFALGIKRALDVIGAVFGLVLCAIAYLLCARRIKRETEGSVIFKQTRVGLNGRRFKLFKFRTMHATAEQRLSDLLERNQMNGHVFKLKDDPRITRLGHIMRRRYIDELPQFWNVMRGEMSLVGTRPPTCGEVSRYDAHHRRRLSMKPGMTGLWQLSGNGRVVDFEEIVRLDTDYIDNWSLWLDLRIMCGTFLKLFRGGGW